MVGVLLLPRDCRSNCASVALSYPVLPYPSPAPLCDCSKISRGCINNVGSDRLIDGRVVSDATRYGYRCRCSMSWSRGPFWSILVLQDRRAIASQFGSRWNLEVKGPRQWLEKHVRLEARESVGGKGGGGPVCVFAWDWTWQFSAHSWAVVQDAVVIVRLMLGAKHRTISDQQNSCMQERAFVQVCGSQVSGRLWLPSVASLPSRHLAAWLYMRPARDNDLCFTGTSATPPGHLRNCRSKGQAARSTSCAFLMPALARARGRSGEARNDGGHLTMCAAASCRNAATGHCQYGSTLGLLCSDKHWAAGIR